MRLELSLGRDQFVWALVEPTAKKFIKPSHELGYQELNLIFSQANPGPLIVETNGLPKWAEKQILSAVRSGQLVNTGDKIDAPAKQTKKVEQAEIETLTESKSKGGRGRSKTT